MSLLFDEEVNGFRPCLASEKIGGGKWGDFKGLGKCYKEENEGLFEEKKPSAEQKRISYDTLVISFRRVDFAF